MRRSIRFTKTLTSRIFGDTFADNGEPGYVDDKDNITTNGVFVYVYTDKNPSRVFLAYLDEFEYVYPVATDPKSVTYITFVSIVQDTNGNTLANFGDTGVILVEQKQNKEYPDHWIVRNDINGLLFVVGYYDFEYRSFDPTKPLEERFK